MPMVDEQECECVCLDGCWARRCSSRDWHYGHSWHSIGHWQWSLALVTGGTAFATDGTAFAVGIGHWCFQTSACHRWHSIGHGHWP
eukprot:1160990-Pelagomonas_calceolata.AAC.7